MPIEKGVNGAPLVLKNGQNFQVIGLHAEKIRGLTGNFSAALKLNEKIFE